MLPGRDPYNLHDLAHVISWVGSVSDPAQPLTTAGEELDDLDDLDRDTKFQGLLRLGSCW